MVKCLMQNARRLLLTALAFTAMLSTAAFASPNVNKVYTVQPYDTLMSISTTFCGSTSFWRVIAYANNLSDPLQPLKVGQQLSIPPCALPAPPAAMSFAGGPFTFGLGKAIAPIGSTHSGGAIATCSGTLPVGLSVAATSGECRISGTPSKAAVAANYTITASNAGGSTTATVGATVK
jgi:LysM repeat protein